MKYNIAINGYGRIGRCVARALYESKKFYDHINLAAINEIACARNIYHLTKFDSTHGCFPVPVIEKENGMLFGTDFIHLFKETDINRLPWHELSIDAVLDCTGIYNDRKAAQLHLNAGAKKVFFSHPGKDEMDATIIYGVNHNILKKEDRIISNASCTTNCLIPILYIIQEYLDIESGLVTTIHSAMNDQPVIDAYNKDLRKTRSALQSLIPVSTSLEKGITRIMPQMEGKFATLALRVPTINVSLMDISLLVNSNTSDRDVNNMLIYAAQGKFEDIMGVSDEQLVSCDFNHDPRSCIIDLPQTKVVKNRLLKLQAWFDNEWGYSNRMLDTVLTALSL